MTVSRGWTWINEGSGLTDEEVERRTPILNALAKEWSNLKTEEENEGFARQSRLEAGEDDGPDFEDEAERLEYETHVQLKETARQKMIETIEEKLSELGARMMRPYEHWNEEEQLIEYLETRYDTY